MMEEFEKIQKAEDRFTSFQKDYNANSKNVTHIIGRNIKLFVCILLPFIMIGFVWTEFGGIVLQTHTIIDVILTVALFTVGEVLMTSIGADGGKFDNEYIVARSELDKVIREVGTIGTLFLGAYCDWQIDLELIQATRFRVRKLKMTPKTFDAIKDLPYNELVEKYGTKKAKKIQEIIDLEPIELNESILLFDGGRCLRGGVPESGDEHINDEKHRRKTILTCFFTGLLAINIFITFTTDISIARVIYTIFKLTLLLFRMAKGYERGSRAYNTIEVKHLNARASYLREYIHFMNNKTYVKLADKYEEIRDLMSEETVPLEEGEV